MFLITYGLGTSLRRRLEKKEGKPKKQFIWIAIISHPPAGFGSYFKMAENSLHFDEGTCYFLVVNETIPGHKVQKTALTEGNN